MNPTDEKRQVDRIERDVYVSLKDYFESILREQNRAIEQASAEREKAAVIQRESLSQHIKSGDLALERHIQEQVIQIKSLIDSQARLVKQAHESAQMAIAKEEESTDKRLDLLNEFRAQSSDEQKRFVPIDVYAEKHSSLLDRILIVEVSLSRLYGGLVVVGIIGVANLVKLWFGGQH